MLSAAIEKLREVFRLADQGRIVDDSPEPRGVYHMITAGGEIVEKHARAAPLSLEAYDVAAFVAGVADLLKARTIPDGTACLVGVGRNLIRAVIRPHGEAAIDMARVELHLEHAMQYKLLVTLYEAAGGGRPKAMDHAAFYKMLRTTLNGCVPDAFMCAAATGSLKNRNDQTQKLGQGKKSLGSDVERELLCDADDHSFPEEVSLTVPVYAHLLDADLLHEVDCAVVVDFDSEDVPGPAFQLIPKAGEIEKALVDVDNALVTKVQTGLKDAELPDGRVLVFAGRV